MNIPNLPVGIPVVQKDGTMHSAWFNFFTQLTQELQQNASNEGIKIPQQSAANIAVLNTAKSTGALLYDQDTHELKVNINGTYKTIQTS